MGYKKEDYISYRVSRSEEAIKDSELAINNNSLFNAENRIYYAIFYLVSALAAKNNYSTSKHKQIEISKHKQIEIGFMTILLEAELFLRICGKFIKKLLITELLAIMMISKNSILNR